jgi:zinc transport system substrate-binding protein
MALAAGCGGGNESHGRGHLDVVAAFYPLAFAAQRVGGADVSVENLTPPGVEPHDLELSARDVQRIRRADVVFYLGHRFQPALEDAVQGADGRVVDVLDGVRLRETHEEGLTADPHVWLDPARFASIVRRMGAVLNRRGPAAALARELGTLDREFRRGLADCRRHEIVTSHAAFGYLAERYGLDQVAITGLSPEAEPAPRELQRVVEDVRRSGATTIFFETLVSPRLAQTVARETGAETAVLDPVEGLTEEEVDAGENYLSVMRSNLAALRKALACR